MTNGTVAVREYCVAGRGAGVFLTMDALKSPEGLSLEPLASRIPIRGVFPFDVLARGIGSACSALRLACNGKLAAS
jgi:hypothetical protein